MMDDKSRIATIRRGDAMGDSTPEVQHVLEDHLGSNSATLDEAGSWISREEYYPFGETSFGSYGKKRYRFCGKERDEESGLYYYGARYYAPWVCRFVSVDALAHETPFFSPYAYADDNPVMNNDPTGNATEPADGGGGSDNLNCKDDASSLEALGKDSVILGTVEVVGVADAAPAAETVGAAALTGLGDSVADTFKAGVEIVRDPVGAAKGLVDLFTTPAYELGYQIGIAGMKTYNTFMKGDAHVKAHMLGYVTGEVAQAFIGAEAVKATSYAVRTGKGAKATKDLKKSYAIFFWHF